jgi:hypothetical protein
VISGTTEAVASVVADITDPVVLWFDFATSILPTSPAAVDHPQQ